MRAPLAFLLVLALAGLAAVLVHSRFAERAAGGPPTAEPLTIAVAHPVTRWLASVLAEGTALRVLPVDTSREQTPGLEAVDAVLGLRSLHPGDPLFPRARAARITVLEIDAALGPDLRTPVVAAPPAAFEAWRDRAGPGLVGLGFANLERMLGHVAAEFARAAPAEAGIVAANLERARIRLEGLRRSTLRAAAAAEHPVVATTTDAFRPLASELGLEIAGVFPREPFFWGDADTEALLGAMRSEAVTVVFAHWELPAPAREAVRAAGGRILLLDDPAVAPGADPWGVLEARFEELAAAW